MNRHPGEDDIDLTFYDEEYNAASPIEGKDDDAVPDGKYQVKVEKVELTETKTTGNPMLKWTLRILGPKCEGRMLWHHNVIGTRENLRWLKTDLSMAGLELGRLSELPSQLERLLDVRLEITKRTKGDSENTYFNRRVAATAPEPRMADRGRPSSF